MKTAVVNLDIINDICHVEGKNARYAGRIADHQIIANINRVTEWARGRGELVIHVRVGFRADYLDGSRRAKVFVGAKDKGALALDGWGGQFCDELVVEGSDLQVIKHRVGGFYGTDLDLILRANDVQRVVLVGVGTNMAVELTAREAHDRDYLVEVVEDASECGSDAEKQASVRVLSRLVTLVSTSDLTQ